MPVVLVLLMGPHDIEAHIDNGRVRCVCGQEFNSAFRHEQHFQVERARAALRGDKENDGEVPERT